MKIHIHTPPSKAVSLDSSRTIMQPVTSDITGAVPGLYVELSAEDYTRLREYFELDGNRSDMKVQELRAESDRWKDRACRLKDELRDTQERYADMVAKLFTLRADNDELKEDLERATADVQRLTRVREEQERRASLLKETLEALRRLEDDA